MGFDYVWAVFQKQKLQIESLHGEGRGCGQQRTNHLLLVTELVTASASTEALYFPLDSFTCGCIFFNLLIFLLAAPRSTWDLRSPTRD